MSAYKRDYSKEYEKSKEYSKKYCIRLPLYLATLFDEKLKKDNKNVSTFFKENVEKYLKKK